MSRLVHRLRASNPALGIGLMVVAMLLFTTMDSIGKSLIAHYPVQQAVWARHFFQLVWMVVLLPRLGIAGLLRTRRPWLHLARGALLATATLCLFSAISVVPLADAYTITFTAPLMVTVLSIPILGEAVGPRRWAAVLVGFAGVLVVIRPGFASVHWALLLPLVTAACFAVYQILTRIASQGGGETAFTMLFHLSWVGAAVMTAVVPFHWQAVAASDWPWMAAMGALGAVGHLILIRALTIAPASLLAPFVYVQIVWALAIGWLWFGDLPNLWMLLGCAIIVGSGLYVIYRETRLGKA